MRFWFYAIAVGLVLPLTFLRGRAPERAAAITLLAGAAASAAHATIMVRNAAGPTAIDPLLVAIDSLVWLVLLAIAVRANRVWPVFLCGLQTIVVIAHLFTEIGTRWDADWRQVYRAMMVFAQAYQIPVLLAGMIAHTVRERRVGRYRDWRRG